MLKFNLFLFTIIIKKEHRTLTYKEIEQRNHVKKIVENNQEKQVNHKFLF
jgi:uncharacterized protein (TIGR02413 family)